MSIKKVNVLKVAGWAHEVFHWIPAKLLTTNVKAYSDHLEYDLQDDQWKNVVIASGPLLVALVIFGLVHRGVSRKRLDKGWLEAAGLYLGSSFWDVVDLLYFFRHGKWRKNAKRWI